MKNNQLIVANENTFVGKIKKFFYNLKIKLFGNRENINIEDIKENSNNNYNQAENKNRFISELRTTAVNENKDIEKNNFLDEIKGNREALSMLSTDRLRKLSKYYDEVIKRNNTIIKNLKKSA